MFHNLLPLSTFLLPHVLLLLYYILCEGFETIYYGSKCAKVEELITFSQQDQL